MANESGHGPLGSLAERVIHRIASNSAFFFYARAPFYWGAMKRVRRALDLQPGERLLDVGCGSGMGAGLTKGMYVGVDTEMAYLRFAHGRLRGRSTHSFTRMSAAELAFGDAVFDKAMMLYLCHHLDEETLDRFLQELGRVVRGKVFVLELSPDHDNAVSGWFQRLDRGAHIRRQADLRALLQRRYDIEREEAFFNLEHTVSCVLFTLVPQRPGSG
jgi:ubiquinone/menaquinone biosynthesis C-methylase UbiE